MKRSTTTSGDCSAPRQAGKNGLTGRSTLRACSGVEEFEFFGRHLLASYTGCEPAALADEVGLVAALKAAAEAAGATLLDSVQHAFHPAGMTAVLLLAESHASIHTYPEHQACFVDLFTCGRSCNAERFDAVLCDYLRPSRVRRQVIVRQGDVEASPVEDEAWPAEWAA